MSGAGPGHTEASQPAVATFTPADGAERHRSPVPVEGKEVCLSLLKVMLMLLLGEHATDKYKNLRRHLIGSETNELLKKNVRQIISIAASKLQIFKNQA